MNGQSRRKDLISLIGDRPRNSSSKILMITISERLEVMEKTSFDGENYGGAFVSASDSIPMACLFGLSFITLFRMVNMA